MADRFTKTDLARANARLKMLTFYPSDPEAQAAIMELLAKICPHLESLTWLVDAMTNHIGTWKGPMELRGVLCWKYGPADGIEACSSSLGFSADDGERVSIERGYMQDPARLESANPESRALVLSIANRKRLM